MSKLIIGCGIPGAGKSTWIKAHAAPTDVIVSRDEIRFQLLEDEDDDDYFAKEDEVWVRYVAQLSESLRADKTVWADATHLTRKSRCRLFNSLHFKPDEIAVVSFECSIATALMRNAKRLGTRGYVPEKQIQQMATSKGSIDFNEWRKPYSVVCYINTED